MPVLTRKTPRQPWAKLELQKSIASGDSQVGEEVDLDEARVIVEKSPTIKLEHPSDAINELILRMVPQARVSLVHDNDWSDVVENHGAEALYDKSSLLDHVKAMYNIHYSGGLAVLRRHVIELSEDFGSSQTIHAPASQVLPPHLKEFNTGQSQYLYPEWLNSSPTQSHLEPNSADLYANMSTEVIDNSISSPVPNIVVLPPEDETWNPGSVNDSFTDPFDINDLNILVGIHDNSLGLTPDLVSSSLSPSDCSETWTPSASVDVFVPGCESSSSLDPFDTNSLSVNARQGDSSGPTRGYWSEDESPLLKDLKPRRHKSKEPRSASAPPLTPIHYGQPTLQ